MPIAVPQAPEKRQGCWFRLPREDGSPSGWFGYTCPKCGATTLSDSEDGFEVADDGTLTPDFVCVNAQCDYTAPLRLKGWTRPVVSVPSPPEPAQDTP